VEPDRLHRRGTTTIGLNSLNGSDSSGNVDAGLLGHPASKGRGQAGDRAWGDGRALLAGGNAGGELEPHYVVWSKQTSVRTALLEEAAAAEGRAAWLDGYLARDDGLDSASLARLVGELEPLPESAHLVAHAV
jgi:hypothetical protein